jgi:hypothetical protein
MSIPLMDIKAQYGPLRAEIEREATRCGLSSVAFRAYLPPKAVIAAMK